MGKFFVFCRIKLKFCFWLYTKRWHTSCKFQFEKSSNKKVIAKKPLTNLYEMNSSSCRARSRSSGSRSRSSSVSSTCSGSISSCNLVAMIMLILFSFRINSLECHSIPFKNITCTEILYMYIVFGILPYPDCMRACRLHV